MRFKGCLYYKKTNSGNIVGEWINNEEILVSATYSNFINNLQNDPSQFPGNYTAIWNEGTDTICGTLIITETANPNVLELSYPENNLRGVGFIADNILIAYFEKINI